MKNISIKKKLSFALFFILSMTILFSGCGSSTVSTKKVSDTPSIVFTDGLGRKIQLDKPAERVLTNYIIPAHMMFVLGAGDRIIGADKKGTAGNPLFKALSPKISDIADFKNKNYFNVEEALALKPDLVLINYSSKNLIDDAEKHGLKVFAIKAETIDDLKDTVKNLGIALGKEKEATSFGEYYDTVINSIKKNSENIKDSDKPTVYIAGNDLYSTASKDMYQHSIIELVGGKNAGAGLSGGWVKVSAEQIIKWDPDIILLTQYCGVKPIDVLNNSSLQGVKAVKNKKVYLFPSKICPLDFPSPQAVIGIEWLSLKVNPDKFSNLNINDEADKFYNKFYGKTFTEFGEKFD